MNQTNEMLIELRKILQEFEKKSISGDLRDRVIALVPGFDAIREIGKSLVANGLQKSARDRLLSYFLEYPRTVLSEKELAVVAGISEWARRVRELRVEFGWKIITGMTASQMIKAEELGESDIILDDLAPNDYVLIDVEQDRDAAHRWNVANEIRKRPEGSRQKILEYLRRNVGKQVTGEELSYVAQSTEWARRTRELRTEEGWPVVTRQSGNPNLPIGVYILEEDRQAPAHDRNISDATRRRVLQRDKFACLNCGWTYEDWNPSDPRFLELHHVIHHAAGGTNEMENLQTLCNVCHDEVHRLDK
ncbi:MAG: HNH endonuclease signature motif containing protein [Spirochaeta sp.]|jgi:hypothetical protein|nr:HNH endonuclease signature motif containing protein [Spirochaeta sp.]